MTSSRSPAAVQRHEILDYETYEEQRAELRARALETKRLRRVTTAGCLAFLFENRETVRYQVLEMVRTERIVKDADVRHELDTYNELLGGRGELGCTLLVGIDDPDERDRKLTRWLDLPGHLYLLTADGRRVRPIWDPRQVGETRLSSVQYLKFPVGDEAPVAIGSDHPDLTDETPLSPEQRAALQRDLGEWARPTPPPSTSRAPRTGEGDTMLEIGAQAPSFTLLDTAREERTLADFRGRPLVIAFFPAAFTGVCEKELCTFRDSLAGLNEVGAAVVAISVDAPFANAAFVERNNLNFAVLSDYRRDAVRAYGVAHDDFAGMQGYTAAKRSVFVVSGEGKIAYAWIAPNPGVEPDYDAVGQAVRALESSSAS